MLTKRSSEKEGPQEGKAAEPFGGESLASQKTQSRKEKAPDQKAESAEQENRRKELDIDLTQEAENEAAEETPETVADIRNKHGDYVMHFVPEARLQVTKEELGEDASFVARTVFALKRKFSMLPETDLQRLDNREADLVQHLVDEERRAFLAERSAQESEEEGNEEEEPEGEEEAAQPTPEPADARRIAAPDIRGALTRGEHDAEQEKHDQKAA